MAERYTDDDDDAGRSMIHRAAARGDTSTVVRLLDEDLSRINELNELTNQPLHEACCAKHLTTVRLLIDRGANVNARGDFGMTPLHYAIHGDGAEANALVALLIESGADIEAKDHRLQLNPLGWALREFNEDLWPTIQTLQDRGSLPGLEGAMILGNTERVHSLLAESPEHLTLEMVVPVLELSKSCGQHVISQMLEDWLLKHSRSD